MSEPLYRIDCPGLRLVNTSNKRIHWSARKALVDRVRTHVVSTAMNDGLGMAIVPLEKAKVGITVWHPGLFDHDGLYCAIKPVLDAIVARKIKNGDGFRRWGLIVDDSPKHCDLAAMQERGAWRVLIEVWRGDSGKSETTGTS